MATVEAAYGAGASAPAKPIKAKLSRDDYSMRGLIVVIIVYLAFALIVPLLLVLTKSVQTYHFTLDQVEVEFFRDGAWVERATLADWVERSDYEVNHGLRASERTREQPAQIIPRGARQDIELFRLRDLSPEKGLILHAGDLSDSDAWIEVDRRQFARVQIRPARSYGLGNFDHYFETPALRVSIVNSLTIALITTGIVIPLAFAYAYGLTRTLMPLRPVFKTIAMVPILVPSLLPAIGLVYLFGNQGILTPLLMGESIYGPIGIVMASAFFAFPHAVLILLVALSVTDARLYEAATALRASPLRTFLTVTLPGARYGLISAFFVVFTLVITDFGVPKVVGGQYNVLALDIYRQVIGQQNFQMGAVVSMILLVPAIVAFTVDRMVTRRQVALLSARAVPYQPKPHRQRDLTFLGICSVVGLFILGILLMCQLAAVFQFWPYDLSLSLRNFAFNQMDGGGWASYGNSIRMALYTAFIGTFLIFFGAYLVEKGNGFTKGRSLFQLFAMMPMAVPGMVLGLAYIFFFNDPANPFNFLYGTMAILVICTITHLYTVSHLTAATALKQMDPEFEAVAASLKQPFWRTFSRVSMPVCLPAMSEIWIYLFVNAMTTVSAVVFLYSPSTTLASVAVLNMDDAGDIAPAAAMGMMIFYTNAGVRILHHIFANRVLGRTQAWRMR